MKRRTLLLLPATLALAVTVAPAAEQAHRAAVDDLYARHFRENGYRVHVPIDYSRSLAWHREELRQHEHVFSAVIRHFDPEVMARIAAA